MAEAVVSEEGETIEGAVVGAVGGRVCVRGLCGIRLGVAGYGIEMPPPKEGLAPRVSIVPAGRLDEARDSLQLLMEMAESMERGPEPLRTETIRGGDDA
eukprot:COSAG02_NODE_4739_length_5036_cov_10.879684_5_plen_98_part_01